MAATATTPPATPPAIAAVFDFDLLPEDEEDAAEDGEGVEDEDEEDAPDREAVEVVGLTFPEAEVPVPINEPGCISGVSEEKRELVR